MKEAGRGGGADEETDDEEREEFSSSFSKSGLFFARLFKGEGLRDGGSFLDFATIDRPLDSGDERLRNLSMVTGVVDDVIVGVRVREESGEESLRNSSIVTDVLLEEDRDVTIDELARLST